MTDAFSETENRIGKESKDCTFGLEVGQDAPLDVLDDVTSVTGDEAVVGVGVLSQQLVELPAPEAHLEPRVAQRVPESVNGNSHRMRTRNASKWDLLLSMGVFTLLVSNIKEK